MFSSSVNAEHCRVSRTLSPHMDGVLALLQQEGTLGDLAQIVEGGKLAQIEVQLHLHLLAFERVGAFG